MRGGGGEGGGCEVHIHVFIGTLNSCLYIGRCLGFIGILCIGV